MGREGERWEVPVNPGLDAYISRQWRLDKMVGNNSRSIQLQGGHGHNGNTHTSGIVVHLSTQLLAEHTIVSGAHHSQRRSSPHVAPIIMNTMDEATCLDNASSFLTLPLLSRISHALQPRTILSHAAARTGARYRF